MTKYVGLVEADAIIVVDAESKEDAEEQLSNVMTGALGPPKVRSVQRDE